MISYLLESGLLLLIFYIVYKLLLENEKMFRFNRAYLLASLIFSLIIPLEIISFESGFSNRMGFIQLDEIVIQKSTQNLTSISINDFLIVLMTVSYSIVVLLLLLRFVLNLFSFYKRIKRNEVHFIQGEKVVLIEEPILPQSFWKSIFINKDAFENGKIPLEFIAHEKAHLEQKHTLDILFVEVLQIWFWFNPLFIFYKKAIKLNHEFLADQAVNKQFDSVRRYQNLLLDFASDKNTVSLASTISYLITKKRLLMMTKKESKTKSALKAFFTVVFSGLLLLIFSHKSVAQKDNEKLKESSRIVGDPIETQPEFPGGKETFFKFIGENFKIPSEAEKNKVSGKLYLQFIVEKEGTLSEIKVLKDLGYGLGNEAIRVLKLSTNWTPGFINGKPVRVLYSLPITIQSAN
ncbi:M56 family metallopeptidase [Flavobacterium gyeonganense]|uniref:M56 family metallopeptidase n=1 Tax=Flavobacterium gyeonganense TaxID=1310418 RepID=A0ABV5HB54_9FLAO|nr:energy transducer TonB [Flavobacterium gyeonganense]